MKNIIVSAALAATGLIASAPVARAQSIDVKVIGTITPAACIPNIAGGGTVDYGNIRAANLNATGYTPLSRKNVAFTIACDAPTMVGIQGVDNRAASRIPGIMLTISATAGDNRNYGLGTVSGANVGGYFIEMHDVTIDGTAVVPIQSSNGGTSWGVNGAGFINNTGAAAITSWGASAATGPIAGENFVGTFSVQAVLNEVSALPLTSDVPLDGAATLELVYL